MTRHEAAKLPRVDVVGRTMTIIRDAQEIPAIILDRRRDMYIACRIGHYPTRFRLSVNSNRIMSVED